MRVLCAISMFREVEIVLFDAHDDLLAKETFVQQKKDATQSVTCQHYTNLIALSRSSNNYIEKSKNVRGNSENMNLVMLVTRMSYIWSVAIYAFCLQ